jgi:sodium-dependent phosphate cotransporter
MHADARGEIFDKVTGPSSLPVRPVVPPMARAVSILLLLFVFLVGIKGMGEGFELLGSDLLDAFFRTTENPFIGLVIGLLATTVMQSSSVTTSMVVALVAAPENPLPLANAIPMIMGANIGTTVTSTIVSLGHMGRVDEFRRAFPVAICHDVFNYMAVLVLLPLELMTGYLQSAAVAIGSLVQGAGGVTYQSPIRTAINGGYTPLERLTGALFDAQAGQAVFLLILSGLLIFTALYLLVRAMRATAHGRVEAMVTTVLGSSVMLSMLIGVVVTVMVQSSSITTSLLVPLAAAGVLRLDQAFPVTLGANIGTTVTAFLAALAVSGPNTGAGLEIALVHLLFNLSGILLVYPVARIRHIPLRLAETFTGIALRSRRMIIVWVVALFYGVPTVVLVVSRWLN